jgi:hypothetical protein
MPDTHDPRRPRVSSALATAALGGLLCFATSCTPDETAASPDASATVDAPAPSDHLATTDTPTATDTGSSSDTSAVLDVVTAPKDAPAADVTSPGDAPAAVDAIAVADAATPADAPTDTPAALDASTGGDASAAMDVAARDAAADGPFVCDVADDRVISLTEHDASFTADEFNAMCDRLGGFVEVHPHCGGANSCRGVSFDQTTSTFTEHSCAGLNTCTGYTCVLP